MLRRHSVALVAFFFLSALPAMAQLFRADPALIDKLYKADFQHISDDNPGRMDLEAVIMAFRTDSEIPKTSRCSIFGDDQPFTATMPAFAQYFRYLNSNSTTGEFPSAQFMAMGIVGAGTLPGPWGFDPNMTAMAAEIKKGCNTTRVQTIRRNILTLLDQRIAWHATDQSGIIQLQKQTLVPIT